MLTGLASFMLNLLRTFFTYSDCESFNVLLALSLLILMPRICFAAHKPMSELHGREFYGYADTSAATDLMVSGPFPYRNIVSPCIGISRTKRLIYRINDIIIRTDCCFIDGMNRCLYLYRLLVLAVAVGGGGTEACKDTIHK